jgi:hypothetical protein
MSCEFTIVSFKLIALMMEAANTSETSVNFYQTTRRNIPEDSHLYSHSLFFQLRGRVSYPYVYFIFVETCKFKTSMFELLLLSGVRNLNYVSSSNIGLESLMFWYLHCRFVILRHRGDCMGLLPFPKKAKSAKKYTLG